MAADAKDTPGQPSREAKQSAPSYQTLETGPAPRPAPPGSGSPRRPSRGCRLPGRLETASSGSVNIPTTLPSAEHPSPLPHLSTPYPSLAWAEIWARGGALGAT